MLLSVMNIKMIVFSGLVTAAAGTVIGLATAEMCKGELKPIQVVNNQLQQEDSIYKYYGLIGASLGLIVGVSQECVRELKYAKERQRKNFPNYN